MRLSERSGFKRLGCAGHAGLSARVPVRTSFRSSRCRIKAESIVSPSPSPSDADDKGAAPSYIATPYGAGRVASTSDADDVLELKDLRKHLKERLSPFTKDNNSGGGFVGDKDKIRLHTVEFESEDSAGAMCLGAGDEDSCIVLPEWCIRAGPRKVIYSDPATVSAAIVTCGGLCPGLNDVVQNLVYTLQRYGVPEANILGIRYGLRGFYERDAKPVTLTRAKVDGIHLRGGTMLGTSRGGANIKEIVKRIDLWGLNMVFVVGGNGGNAAANAIQQECEAQGVVCSVVGVPKSIDNDILLIDRCFGFETAVEEAQRALLAAKVEAASARNGLGLVKLMGRQSGFIAMQASMACGVVDVCLIPEITFSVDKLCAHVEAVIRDKGHAVVCVAEGAGQEMMDALQAVAAAAKNGGGGGGGNGQQSAKDASGNPILQDIGPFLKDAFKRHFKGEADIKYIDPTYMIRAIPTTSNDRVYCKVLGQAAVHGAFAGYTGFTVGLVNTHYVMLPIPVIIQSARRVNPKGRRWSRLKTAIGQPDFV